MSYDLYVDGKFEKQIGSNRGWYDTLRYLEKHGGKCCKELANTGECQNAYELNVEIKSILSAAPPDVAHVLQELLQYNRKHSHIGISQE